MSCENCGSPAVDITNQTGAIDEGRFSERWECETCGAIGTIRGEASAPPNEWKRTGSLFE